MIYNITYKIEYPELDMSQYKLIPLNKPFGYSLDEIATVKETEEYWKKAYTPSWNKIKLNKQS